MKHSIHYGARRTSLAVAVLATAALWVSAASPAPADDSPAPVVTDLGAAAVGTAVNGAELVGDNLYLVSRQALPATLTTLDLSEKTVSAVTPIPSGIEGWAATAVNDGRDLYFGMHTPADLYHFDTVDEELTTEPVATFEKELLVMDQAGAPDDVVYVAGMARGSSGGVYAYDPATNTTEDLGTPVPGQRYVRSIVVNEDTVFAGMGPAASIQYRPRSGGAWTPIEIPDIADESFVYDMALEGGFLTFGTEPGGLFGIVDIETMETTIVPVPEGRTIDSIVMDSTTAYFTVRPEGSLWSYDLATTTLTNLATPQPGSEHRKLFLSDGGVIGVTGAGDTWIYTIADGTVELTTSIQSNMPRSPERAAQSLEVLGGDAYVAGHWGIQRHNGTEGDSTRFAIPGETKTMATVDGILMASIYPSSQVWTYDPASEDTNQLVQIRDNQMRPRASHVNAATGTLLVATRETYGNVGGAVSVIDPETGAISTHRDIVQDQAPISLTSFGSTAFIGHEIAGEVHPPTTTEAHVVSWHIPSASKGWDVVPVAGSPAITGLAAWTTSRGEIIYGTSSDGQLFALDAATGVVIQTVKLANTAADVIATDSGVYVLTALGIHRIETDAPSLTVENLVPGSFTHVAVDDTDPLRLYAVGIRTVDGSSQARLFSVDLTGIVTPSPKPTTTVTITAAPSSTPTVTTTVTATASSTATTSPGTDVYTTPGFHEVSGRQWMTVCEPYSVTTRCWTWIWATQVHLQGGQYFQTNGWTFNNLTYVASPRATWAGNPLGNSGSWTASDGRKWRTECDTPATGRKGCRSYALSTVHERTPAGYRTVSKWVFNNIVRFS